MLLGSRRPPEHFTTIGYANLAGGEGGGEGSNDEFEIDAVIAYLA